MHWRYSEEAPRAVYAVEPMNKPVLRYQGGDVVPLNLLGRFMKPPLPWHRRRPRNRPSLLVPFFAPNYNGACNRTCPT